MSAKPIRYFDRYKKTIETEQVYGGDWLRWIYETSLGRMSLGIAIKRAFVSRYYGWKMSLRSSANRVLPFIVDYDMNVDEFAKKPLTFKSFNDFFYRALKPGARPIAAGERIAVLPADGRHLAFQNVDASAGFYAKGQRFSMESFLDDKSLAKEFEGGAMVISRLCPVDYHRFHFPVSGLPAVPRLINGWLYSVSPIALRRNLAYLWENKRMITIVESSEFGRVAICEIGATMVGSISQTFSSSRAAVKGEEKGLFKFGGSCVITIFQAGRIKLDDDLVSHSAEGMEVYARMGDRLGEATR